VERTRWPAMRKNVSSGAVLYRQAIELVVRPLQYF